MCIFAPIKESSFKCQIKLFYIPIKELYLRRNSAQVMAVAMATLRLSAVSSVR